MLSQSLKNSKMVIYKCTHITDGNFYIGYAKVFKTRYGMHLHRYNKKCNGHFYSALIKYGWNSFTWEVIDSSAQSIEELKQLEIKYIAELKPQYNMTAGGDGGTSRPVSIETKEKISKANKGNKYCLGTKRSQDSKLKMSIVQQKRIRTPEELKRWSSASKGKKRSDQFKKNLSEKLKGRVRSPEHSLAISLAKKGKLSHRKGVPMHEEQKLKISNKLKGNVPWNKGLKKESKCLSL